MEKGRKRERARLGGRKGKRDIKKKREWLGGRERFKETGGERVLSQTLDRQTLDKTNPRQQKY